MTSTTPMTGAGRAPAVGLPVFGALVVGDGVRLRTARWSPPGPPRGDVVLLNGRTEFIEKYLETAGALVGRGFAVHSLDWRNQGLSGGRPPDNPQKHHVADFTTLVDDLDLFVEQVVQTAEARPLVLVAHSMGGLVATLHLAKRPRLYTAAILSAPMHDIRTGGTPRWLAAGLAAVACAVGCGARYAFGQRDYDETSDGIFTPDNPITSDPARWRVYHDAFRDRPALRVGGVTWGWLRAAFRASEAVRCRAPLLAVETPVLLLSAPADAVVDPAAHTVVARRFGECRLIRYPESRHEPLMECDAIRDRVWADIDGFLDRLGL